jgi:hypothetical protein
MKTQVIGHSGKGRGSRFIVWFTRGKFSHVSLRFMLTDAEIKLFEDRYEITLTNDHEIESIQGKGVHHQPFVPSPNQTWFNFAHDPEQARIILSTAIELIGCKYDWRGVGGFLTRRNKQNPEKWFCSELVAWCLLSAGIRLLWMACHKQSPTVTCASTVLSIDQDYEKLKRKYATSHNVLQLQKAA